MGSCYADCTELRSHQLRSISLAWYLLLEVYPEHCDSTSSVTWVLAPEEGPKRWTEIVSVQPYESIPPSSLMEA